MGATTEVTTKITAKATMKTSTEVTESSDDLSKLRVQIDDIDTKILSLLWERAELSGSVAKSKGTASTYRPEREEAILQRLYSLNLNRLNQDNLNQNTSQKISQKMSQGTSQNIPQNTKKNTMISILPNEHINKIWTEIFSSSRALQKAPLVAFLGPEGTFSHHALYECLGHSVESIACHDFEDIFMKVYSKEYALGLIPLENSQQGSVGQCLDLFNQYPVSIIEEHYSHIMHSLLTKEQSLSQIQVLISHPQALMQCHSWIRENLASVTIKEVSSTAAAVKLAKELPHSAAIAHEDMAQESLQALAHNINQNPHNYTRFAIIAAKLQEVSPKNPKTSFTFIVSHKAGALVEILRILEASDINLVKLESRPSTIYGQGQAWEYQFFVDAASNLLENKEVLAKLQDVCHYFQILGVYENKVLN